MSMETLLKIREMGKEVKRKPNKKWIPVFKEMT